MMMDGAGAEGAAGQRIAADVILEDRVRAAFVGAERNLVHFQQHLDELLSLLGRESVGDVLKRRRETRIATEVKRAGAGPVRRQSAIDTMYAKQQLAEWEYLLLQRLTIALAAREAGVRTTNFEREPRGMTTSDDVIVKRMSDLQGLAFMSARVVSGAGEQAWRMIELVAGADMTIWDAARVLSIGRKRAARLLRAGLKEV